MFYQLDIFKNLRHYKPSMNAAACLGNPLGSRTPTSVEVPPTSTTIMLLAISSFFLRSIPAKNEAPSRLLSRKKHHEKYDWQTAHRVGGTRRKGSDGQPCSIRRTCECPIILASGKKSEHLEKGKINTNLGEI
jgi:hypothetical protein